MKKHLSILNILFIVAMLTGLFACNSSKYLTDGEVLYTGADVKIKSSGKTPPGKEIKAELNDLLRPTPNSKLLGIRFKLWVYNAVGPTKKQKGIKHWLRTKVGEPPVLASPSAMAKNRAVLQNRLENRGYFHDTVTLDTSIKDKKLKATYTALVGDQYKIRNVKYAGDSTDIGLLMQRMAKRSLLKPGDAYDLDVIKAERTRIDAHFKQKGFYYFAPDFIIATVDSTIGDHKIDITVSVKKSTPPKAKDVYHINDIIVFADYSLNTDTSLIQKGTQKYDGYTIVDPANKFKPAIFSRALVFKKGAIYNRDDHNLALNRLITLGTFRYVKARFEEVPPQPADTGRSHLLNTYYYLSPTKKKSIRLETSAYTKTNSANGSEITLSWRNKNLLRGAELFTVSAYGGFEIQVVKGAPNINIFRYGADVSIAVPRIIAPINFKTNSGYMPKTTAELGYELYSRSDQYTLNSFKANYGYVFKESVTKEHQLNIIALSFVEPTNISDSFQKHVLDSNIIIARSIEKQLIIGATYNYNYNSQVKANKKRNNFYFNGNLDVSGNIIGLLSGANVANGNEKKILGVPYSQYVRGEVDFRHYLSFGKYTVLASRFTGGVGYAYGNSLSMPYVKAFFAGGTNDIRAFASRSLGPGAYYAGNPKSVGYVGDQPGDMKLEANTELRVKLFSVIRGAIFFDAGNTWLIRDDPERPGAKFSNQFLSQMAIGTGAGLRFDFGVFVVRIDAGVPLRYPTTNEGFKWAGGKDYFSDIYNYTFNIAIGYPF
jgi:outer membrane protein assembly factor BamA